MSRDSDTSTRRERQSLLEAVANASRESSTMAVFFHTIIASQVDMGATEQKTLLLLHQFGPLTAGEIAQHTGLTTPSVTSLVDRLENKNFVRRVRDTQDRRRVIVERNEEQLAQHEQVYQTLHNDFIDFLAEYSDEQLATIEDFLKRSVQRSREFIDTRAWQKGGEQTTKL